MSLLPLHTPSGLPQHLPLVEDSQSHQLDRYLHNRFRLYLSLCKWLFQLLAQMEYHLLHHCPKHKLRRQNQPMSQQFLHILFGLDQQPQLVIHLLSMESLSNLRIHLPTQHKVEHCIHQRPHRYDSGRYMFLLYS